MVMCPNSQCLQQIKKPKGYIDGWVLCKSCGYQVKVKFRKERKK